MFVVMTEARAIASIRVAARARHDLRLSGARHYEKVEQIATAGSAQVSVAEAHNGGVGDVIAGAPVPLIVEGIGAQLNRTEWNSCAWKSVSVAAGADLYIDKRRRIGGGRRLGPLDDLTECASFRCSDSADCGNAAEECSS